MIPKIIHQTAPSDTGRWPPVWRVCQQSVRASFPDFEYRMWSDMDLESMVKETFPWFFSIYKDYPASIYRADAGRYMILYLYGGIYIDMDMEILVPFYERLARDRPSIVESPFPNVERFQNSLMASPVHHPFWLEVLREMASTAYVMRKNVLDATGPRMLDRVIEEHPDQIYTLSYREFNPPPKDSIYNSTVWHQDGTVRIYSRHHYTAVWR
jgi:mannosyltransferase OCH1-like enzyme